MIFVCPCGVFIMGQINLSDYRNIYLETAKEYANNIFSGYSKLSANSQDKEAVAAIHLSAHSLKGQSQIMGFTNIVNLCEGVEESLEDILKGVDKVDDNFVALLKKSVDDINLELSLIEKGNIT